jgi:hypothetical protein
VKDRVACAVEIEHAIARGGRRAAASRARRQPAVLAGLRLAMAAASKGERRQRARGNRGEMASSDRGHRRDAGERPVHREFRRIAAEGRVR